MEVEIPKSKKSSTIIFAIVFLIGLSLLLYPLVANQWNSYRQRRLISNYEESVKELESSGEIDYEKEWEEANAYNAALLPSILPDSFAIADASEEEDEEYRAYMDCLNLTGDGIMGMIEIPKIDVKLPIYHTTEKDVLEKAVGHLVGSSLPVGGESTHTVIVSQRRKDEEKDIDFSDWNYISDRIGNHALSDHFKSVECLQAE